ncbi:sugar phosphate isomerase/epimerase [soil metagenome]
MPNSPLRLGVSSYSYWHFTPQKTPLEYVIDRAHGLGLFGVEISQEQLESMDNAYLQQLKRHAFRKGVALYNLGTSQDFVWDDADKRRENVEHTKRCIDLAHALGVPSIRVNAGTWRRGDDSGTLQETRGWTEPWLGATQDDGFNWATEGLLACTRHAESLGVMMLLENHWGLTTTAAGMLRVLEGVNSPWLRAILDMGNFYYDTSDSSDMYAAMEKIAPWVDLAHAKTYPGGGLVFTISIDFERVFRLLNAAGFTGYVSIEMEGHEHADTAVPKSIETLQEAWDRASS